MLYRALVQTVLDARATHELRHATRIAWSIGLCGLAIGLSFALPEVRAAFVGLDHRPGVMLDFEIYLDQAHRLSAVTRSFSPRWFYPPFSALLFMGFNSLDVNSARLLWGLIQGLLCVWLVVHCASLMPSLPRRQRALCALGLVLSSLPVAHCVKWGQVSVLVTMLSVLGLERAGVGGAALLGIAVAIKLYPVSYSAAYAVRGRVASLLWLIAVACALGIALPALVLGPELTGMMIGRMLGAARTLADLPGLGHQTLPMLFLKWFGAADAVIGEPGPISFSVPIWLLRIMSVGCEVSCLAITLWICRRRSAAVLDVADIVSIVLCATLLLEPAWLHYFVVLPLGHAVLLERSARRPRELVLLALSVCLSAGSLCACLIEPAAFEIVVRSGTITLSALLCLIGLWFTPARIEAGASASAQRSATHWVSST